MLHLHVMANVVCFDDHWTISYNPLVHMCVMCISANCLRGLTFTNLLNHDQQRSVFSLLSANWQASRYGVNWWQDHTRWQRCDISDSSDANQRHGCFSYSLTGDRHAYADVVEDSLRAFFKNPSLFILLSDEAVQICGDWHDDAS